MVATSGLTRSNGSVSQAGKSATVRGGRKACRSWVSRSASATVAVTTRSGRRSPSTRSPARTYAVAASGTASVADPAAMASTMAGSRRRSGARDLRLTRSGYRRTWNAPPRHTDAPARPAPYTRSSALKRFMAASAP